MAAGGSGRRTALVTGGNRGIGLEVCRQLARAGLDVLLAAREAAAGEEAAARLRQEGLAVQARPLDVTRRESVQQAAAALVGQGVRVDVLVNNAGILGQTGVLDSTPEEWVDTLGVNFFGALWTCQAFVPGMVRAGHGRIVNVTSGWGSFAEGLGGPAPYSVSKAALNGLTVTLARELSGDVKVNAVCPGWVRTRMGGPGASRSPEEAAADIVWAATLPAEGPSGGFFRYRRPVAW